MAEELKYDLSVVLTNKIDFTRCCYTHDIQLVDNIRGLANIGGILVVNLWCVVGVVLVTNNWWYLGRG